MINTIIFDYGGVISTESRSKQFYAWATQEFNVPKEKLTSLFKEKSDIYQTGKCTADDFWGCFIKLGIPRTVKELQEQFASYNKPDENILNLINRLINMNYSLSLISDTFPELTEDLRNRFSSVFNPMIFSDEAGYSKQDMALYEVAFQKIGKAPEHCIYIDDKPENLVYLASIGVTCIHYNGFNQFIRELVKYLPEHKEILLNEFLPHAS